MINPKISRATLGRAPAYLKFLRGIEDSTANISATTIAKELELGEVQVRKDLRALCGSGKPKTGYKVGELTASLASCLSEKDGGTVIIGAGKLGRALLDYAGFADYGLNILAAFDIAVAEPVASPKGKYIYPVSELDSFCSEHNTRIGIIASSTVSTAAAIMRFSVFFCFFVMRVASVWGIKSAHRQGGVLFSRN